MARTPEHKELKNARLLKAYASWIYCASCNQTVVYLCYTAYDQFDFAFTCQCGGAGHVHIRFPHNAPADSAQPLSAVKNRLCCPNDGAPPFSVVVKNLRAYRAQVVCNQCGTAYTDSLLRSE